jgi:hypothetical protein
MLCKIKQNSPRSTGNIDHPVFSVFSRKLQIKIQKSRMIVFASVHFLQIEIIVFRHIIKIM